MRTSNFALAIALALGGCAQSDYEWAKSTVTVAPVGEVPDECRTLPPMHVPSPGAKSAEQTLEEYIALQDFTLAQRRRYARCQKWAKAQR